MRYLIALAGAGLLFAQVSATKEYGYEVVTIKKADPGFRGTRIGRGPQGGMRTENTSLLNLITFAYDVRDYQVLEAAGWVKTDGFDVSFTPDRPEALPGPGVTISEMDKVMDRQRSRLRAILKDRFGLVLRQETRQLPVYSLVMAKGGHKLKTPDGSKKGPSMSTNGERGQMNGFGVNMKLFTNGLSGYLRRPVLEETGFTDPFDIKLTWNPDAVSTGTKEDAPADIEGASIFTAVQAQLGLKLEAARSRFT